MKPLPQKLSYGDVSRLSLQVYWSIYGMFHETGTSSEVLEFGISSF